MNEPIPAQLQREFRCWSLLKRHLKEKVMFDCVGGLGEKKKKKEEAAAGDGSEMKLIKSQTSNPQLQ